MRNRCLAFLADKRASIAVSSAILLPVVIGVAALGVDIGSVYTDRRKAQGTADLAAMAAVTDIVNADKAASATILRNNHAQGTSYKLELGTYAADPGVAVANRFQKSTAANANAARITLTTSTPLFFGRLLTGGDQFKIETTSAAARTAFASFAIGSRLVAIDGGLLNQLLGGLLGGKLSLSVMDYQALVNTQIELFGFMDALATRMSLTGATYDTLLNSYVSVGQITAAMVDTQRQTHGSTSQVVRALSDVSQAVQGLATKMRVGDIVDVGPYRTLPVGQRPKASVSVSTLDMLTATAQMANGKHQVELNLNLNVPGIVSSALKVAIGERPKGTSWITVGAQGASVHTAQTRILLTVNLAGAAPVASVKLPLYIELASGTARLNSQQCGFPNVADSTVTLGVTPSVIDAWIGEVSNSDFVNFTNAPNPPAAKLVDTVLLSVTGRAHATVTNLAAIPVTFNYSEIEQKTKKTVGTKNYTATLLGRLFSDLQLSVSILGLGLGLPSAITGQVGGILSKAATPIDQVLSSVLSTLGIGLGQADVWVLGVRCDGAVLVN